MTIFNIHDIIQFAIRIEENGETFYRKAAQSGDNKEAAELFNRLADEEVNHKKVFEEMKNHLGEYTPNETYEGEYARYLHEYIDQKAIFIDGLGDMGKDTISALEFALQREMDSILYYVEVKRFVSDRHHNTINNIIAEEKKHFSRISELKKKLA